MGKEKTSTATAATPKYEDYILENVKVIGVTRVCDNNDERISFKLNKTFKSFDFKTKEEIETDTFSLNINEVSRQLESMVDVFMLASAYMMGGSLPATLVSLVMKNATVTVKRIFKAKDEQRENSTDTYTMNLYKSVFVSVETDINPLFEKAINKELEKISNFEVEEKAKKRAEVTETTTRKAVFGW